MKTIHSDDHRLHHAAGEFIFGEFRPPFEKPERVELVIERIGEVGLGEIIQPVTYPDAKITAVHDAGLVAFLESCHREWVAAGRKGDANSFSFRARRMRDDRIPTHVDGKLAHYAFDQGVPITATSWTAIRTAVDVALTGADLVLKGDTYAFSLCRPPGHHAGKDYYGGYCYLNNAAIAAQHALDSGAKRVAILDVDYHHGNGTQDIFYDRSDVFFASLHGDPETEYPFLLGWADERGVGAGEGFNANYPLPWGSDYSSWGPAHDDACRRIEAFAPDIVIVSLGVDTFKDDPISKFKLANEDYLKMGERIAKIGRPTLFVMEGGYAVADIGINAVNVLQGCQNA